MNKKELLQTKVEHVSLQTFNPVPLVDSMQKMAFQARNTARAADIYCRMLAEKDCAVILCLAGSLISAGLKKAIVELLDKNMVDAIVSTGANIVDQDFFEGPRLLRTIRATPFRWTTTSCCDQQSIDRIYDTYIDEDELRICDNTIARSPTLPGAPVQRRVSSSPRWANTWRSQTARTRSRSCWRMLRSATCRSSARRSATAAPASGSSSTSGR